MTYSQDNGQPKTISKILAKERQYNIAKLVVVIAASLALAIFVAAKYNETQNKLQASAEAQKQTLDALKQLSVEQKAATNDVKLTVKRLGDANLCVLLSVAQKLGQGIQLDSINTNDIKKNCQSEAITINPDGTVLEQPKQSSNSPAASNAPTPPSSPSQSATVTPSPLPPPKDEGFLPDTIPVVGPLL